MSAGFGFAAVFLNKEVNNRKHFVSWHGKFGLATSVAVILAIIGGVIAKYSTAGIGQATLRLPHVIKFFSINNSTSNTSFPEVLRRWVKPINLKLYHATGAMLVFMLAMATVALACYSNWFKNRVEGRVEYRIDMNIKLPSTNSKLQPNPGLSSFFAIFQDGFGDFVSGPRLSLQFAWLGK